MRDVKWEAHLSPVAERRQYARDTAPSDDWIEGPAVPIFANAAVSVAACAPLGSRHVERLTANDFVIVSACGWKSPATPARAWISFTAGDVLLATRNEVCV